MDILIFDDDTVFAELMAETVQAAGYSVEKLYSAYDAISQIRNLKPRLILLDVMMPGMDGITLCQKIKSDPELSSIIVIAISAKSFKQDRQEALRCGADLFFPKPCDFKELRRVIVGRLQYLTPGSVIQLEAAPGFYARVLGCRSSAAQPGGPPTSCVLLGLGKRLIVLDAGSGVEKLERLKLDRSEELWILLTHYHEDHVFGLPALARVAAGFPRVRVVGPSDTRRPLEDLLRSAFKGASMPPSSDISVVGETNFLLGPDVHVSTMFTRHPGSTLAYRVSHKGHRVVYCPDNALGPASHGQDHPFQKLARFVQGAQVLIHDARYSDEEIETQAEAEHSSPARAVELALLAGVRDLMLFHADASYSEEHLAQMTTAAQVKLRAQHSPLRVHMAHPDTVIGI